MTDDAPTAGEQTLYEIRDGAAWITLNRPEVRNALSATLVNGLYDHLQAAYADDAVRAVVLTGAGTAFCSGADLKNPPMASGAGVDGYSFADVVRTIYTGPKPVLAAINGAAFAGGLGLVAAADIAIAADHALFGFSEVRIGVIPAIISVVCLPKLGRHHGMRLFLTGEHFDAAAAVGYGLLHRAVPSADLEEVIAEELAALRLAGPQALAECKRLVHRVSEWSFEEGLAETEPWSRRLFNSDEAREGMTAFREKRSPRWVSASGVSAREGESSS